MKPNYFKAKIIIINISNPSIWLLKKLNDNETEKSIINIIADDRDFGHKRNVQLVL